MLMYKRGYSYSLTVLLSINDNLRCAVLDEYMDKCDFRYYLDTMFETPRHHCETLLYLATDNDQN